MSLLKMTCPYVGVLDLKVLTFNSPMTGSFSSSQTKRNRHHWPVKASQQALSMKVQFNGWPEYKALQEFVRAHHIRSIQVAVDTPEVTLYWPQRGINNWSGLIKGLSAGDERFNIAPTAQLDIILIDSMLSEKTFGSSFGDAFAKFFESDSSDPTPFKPPNPANQPGSNNGGNLGIPGVPTSPLPSTGGGGGNLGIPGIPTIPVPRGR